MMYLKGKKRHLKITPIDKKERNPIYEDSAIDQLQSIVYERAKAKYGTELDADVKERLAYELATVERLGYAALFLWLSEIVAEARSMGVYVGPARGYAPASLVLYLLCVTSIDPVAHGLLVERFINAHTNAPLCIDITIAPEGALDFIHWFEKQYGISVDTDTPRYTLCDIPSVKVSMLALSSLSKLREAESQEGIDMGAIPLNDPKVFDLFSSGDTKGIYMCESHAVRRWLVDLQPSHFSDLTALLALSRPGLVDLIPEFIARKHAQEPIACRLEVMDDLLQETYGMLIYQEQLMRLGQRIAGLTRDDSDLLRRVLCKAILRSEMHSIFVAGGVAHGYSTEMIDELWGELFKEGRYTFNKSHAVSQALIAYQTAYLKVHGKG